MKVYRVEHTITGKGPYRQRWPGADKIEIAHWLTEDTHPRPPWGYRNKKYTWGFVSMRDLFRWFGGWLPLLLTDGFTVRVYDVEPENVIVLDRQAAIRKAVAS